MSRTPERQARAHIDDMLREAGWAVQDLDRYEQILTGGAQAVAETTWTAGITFPIPDGEVDVDGTF